METPPNPITDPITDEEYKLNCILAILIKGYLKQKTVLVMRSLSKRILSLSQIYPLKVKIHSVEGLKQIKIMVSRNRIKIRKLSSEVKIDSALEILEGITKILEGITELTFRYISNYEHEMTFKSILPSSIKKLVFSLGYFEPNIFSKIPESITHLTIRYNVMNQYYQIASPDSILVCPKDLTLNLTHLTHLTLGYYFNYRVESLPQTITHLVFGDSFNKEINIGNLPPNLTHLFCGNSFNKKVNNLPPNITHLSLGNSFTKSIDDIPLSITHLSFGHSFNRSINNLSSRSNLKSLTLGDLFGQPLEKLPSNLQCLNIGREFNSRLLIPLSLVSLIFCWGSLFNRKVEFAFQDQAIPSLRHLTFGKYFNLLIDDLPLSLTHLTLREQFNKRVDHLPSNLTHLIFGDWFNQPVNHLPQSLIYLEFGNLFNKKVKNLPSNLHTLIFGPRSNLIRNKLPQKIRNLTVPTEMVDWVGIPDSVTSLYTIVRLPGYREEDVITLKWTRDYNGRRIQCV